MRVVAASLLWLSAGCGRVGFAAIGDAAVADVAVADVAAPDAGGPFGAATPDPDLSSPSFEDDPSLTADLLDVVFASDRPGGQLCDLWTSTRPDAGARWGPPQNLSAVNSSACESGAAISKDGLTLVFASNRAGANSQLYISTRAGRGAAWNPPNPIAELASSSSDSGPSLGDDLRSLYFYSNRSGNLDLYVATRSSPLALWDPPRALVELATPVGEISPDVAVGGGALLFASKRPGGPGGGSYDLWQTTRSDPGSAWLPPSALVELSSNRDEDDPWLSPDGRTIWFARDEPNSDRNIYVAYR